MKKLSLFLGTLGGALAGYVFSNTNLREELANAKDAETAGKILAKHLQKDSKQIGKEVKQFVDSDVVQNNMKKAQTYVTKNAKKLQNDLTAMVSMKKKAAKSAAPKVAKVKKMVSKKKAAVKKAVKMVKEAK
jgi:hypothetical protein